MNQQAGAWAHEWVQVQEFDPDVIAGWVLWCPWFCKVFSFDHEPGHNVYSVDLDVLSSRLHQLGAPRCPWQVSAYFGAPQKLQYALRNACAMHAVSEGSKCSTGTGSGGCVARRTCSCQVFAW